PKSRLGLTQGAARGLTQSAAPDGPAGLTGETHLRGGIRGQARALQPLRVERSGEGADEGRWAPVRRLDRRRGGYWRRPPRKRSRNRNRLMKFRSSESAPRIA